MSFATSATPRRHDRRLSLERAPEGVQTKEYVTNFRYQVEV